jgi:hypothetical protein
MAKRDKRAPEEPPVDETPAEAAAPPRVLPEPIGTVRRLLVHPDGRKIAVDVPVYPPFRLDSEAQGPPKPAPRRPRKGAKPRPTGSD